MRYETAGLLARLRNRLDPDVRVGALSVALQARSRVDTYRSPVETAPLVTYRPAPWRQRPKYP